MFTITAPVTPAQKARIVSAIKEYDGFIERESARSDIFRPEEVKQLLSWYIAKRAELQAIVDAS